MDLVRRLVHPRLNQQERHAPGDGQRRRITVDSYPGKLARRDLHQTLDADRN